MVPHFDRSFRNTILIISSSSSRNISSYKYAHAFSLYSSVALRLIILCAFESKTVKLNSFQNSTLMHFKLHPIFNIFVILNKFRNVAIIIFLF